MLKYLLVFFAFAFFCGAFAQSCTPQTLSVFLNNGSALTTVNIENGYTVLYTISETSSSNTAAFSVVGGASVTFNSQTNTVTIGNPSSSSSSSSSFSSSSSSPTGSTTTSTSSPSSPSIRAAPMWILAFCGLFFSLQFPRSTVLVVFVALLALSQVQLSQSQCTKTVTITVSGAYIQNIKVGTSNQIQCDSQYDTFEKVYDGQCVNWIGGYNLLYSNPTNPAACANILPQTASIIAAPDNWIKLNAGTYYQFDNSALSTYAGTSKLISQITLPSGVQATLVVFAAATDGFNNFPVSIISGSTTCNATYQCQNGTDCIDYFDITNTTSNFWCNSWSSRASTPTNCTGSSGGGCSTAPDYTCGSFVGCDYTCQQTGGAVTCGSACDPTIYGCGNLYCTCCPFASVATLLVPSVALVAALFAFLFNL